MFNLSLKNSIGKAVLTILLILLAIGILILFAVNRSQTLEDFSSDYGIFHPDANDFIITKNEAGKITAINGDKILKLQFFENVTEDFAKQYVKEKTTLFNGLFERQLPPYPEFLTRETGCEERFKPLKREDGFGEYYIVYAGSRLGYGVCVDDLVEYRAVLGYLYCQNRNLLLKFEYFTQEDVDDEVINAFARAFQCV